MLESRLTSLFKKEIDKNPDILYYNITASMYSKKGWPDIILAYKGLMIGVELKVGNNTLSVNQKIVSKEFLKKGVPFFVLKEKNKEFHLSTINKEHIFIHINICLNLNECLEEILEY